MKRWIFFTLLQKRLSIAFVIILQIALFVFLVVNGSRFSIWIEYGLLLSSILVVFHVVGESSDSAFKLIWITLILAFPVFGGLLYLLFNYQSSTWRFREDLRLAEDKTKPLFLLPPAYTGGSGNKPPAYAQLRYLHTFAGFPAYRKTRTEYLTPGEVKFERLAEVLRRARHYIFLEYFSIAEGILWNTLLEILKEKAAAGVEVRVIYDDVGSLLLLPHDYPKQLAKFGIRCEIFNPFRPFLSAKQNNRDHRKIAVVDGKIAITGGINLADEYINARKKYGHWKDAAVLVEGEAAWSFTLMFLQMWSICTKTQEDYTVFYPWGAEPCPVLDDGLVQPYADSPLDTERVGEHVYLQIIYNAKQYVYINTPYLVIDDQMMTALSLAAKSGVDVRIVTPYHPDKFYVHMVTRSNYRELIKAGVKVYEYSDGFIHSKTFISDGKTATVGTSNLDYRSLYLSFECGVSLYGSSAIKEMHTDFLQTLEKCHPITEQDCRSNRLVRLLQNVLRLLSPLL